MKNDWTITQEAFDNLLTWLDMDRERAGQKYEEIRCNLIRIFARRGCPVAEELTDETINRVTRKALDIAGSYAGDPCLYFYGVAQNVYKEYVKKRPDPLPLPEPDPVEGKERHFDCLDRCMERLDPQSRELILEYYRDERRAKINRRQRLAEQLGITLNTLRARAHRIKLALQQCVGDCLMQSQSS
ncbi:MAG: hypothetical protein L0229_23115 [Blastocatellia bacterium]|nr:hypothetical protein [Blastocatellia bacterium]